MGKQKDYVAGPKRGVAEREVDLERITRLHVMGYSVRAIAEALGNKVSHQQVHKDLLEVQERFRASTQATKADHVAEIIERLRATRHEAWLAWEKSKEDQVKLVEESGTTGGGQSFDKQQETTEGSCGDPAYLRIVLDCDKQVRDLLGLDEPVKVKHSGDLGVSLNLYEMTRPPDLVVNPEADPVEARIRAMEQLGHDPGKGGQQGQGGAT